MHMIILKKLLLSAIKDPVKFLKTVLGAIAGILVLITIIFSLFTFLFWSIPSSLWTLDNMDPETVFQNEETIKMYEEVPVSLNQEINDWVSKIIQEIPHDDVRISNSYSEVDLWIDLLAIDTIRLEQDFSKTSRAAVQQLGRQFIKKSSRTEEYEAIEYIYNEETDSMIPETVSKTRLIIDIDMLPTQQILARLGFALEEKDRFELIRSATVSILSTNYNIYEPSDYVIKEYPSGSAKIPYYSQLDIRWGNQRYGRKNTIAGAGCGPTALAMVVSGLKNRLDITPSEIAKFSEENGHRVEGVGTAWSLMSEGAKEYGLSPYQISRTNKQGIVNALSGGKVIIVSMGKGHFTRGGHFIVLYGINQNGEVLVHDPASVSRSRAWDLNLIMRESSKLAGVKGSPFWAY